MALEQSSTEFPRSIFDTSSSHAEVFVRCKIYQMEVDFCKRIAEFVEMDKKLAEFNDDLLDIENEIHEVMDEFVDDELYLKRQVSILQRRCDALELQLKSMYRK
jgi:hypothetical protein